MTTTIAAIGCGLLLLGTAHAADERPERAFDIKPQSLAGALSEFARQSQKEILFAPRIVANKLTEGVQGNLEPLSALSTLLQNTGLSFSMTPSGAILVGDSGGAASAAKAGLAVRIAQNNSEGLQNAHSTDKTAIAQNNTESPGENKDPKNTEIAEIVVTARKRAERLQDVPISIAVVTAEEISRRGLVGAADYLRGIPGVNQVEGGYGGQAVVIRGIEASPAYQNFNLGPTTATYFGETPTTHSAGLLGANVDIKLVDIERVEVLRGPQGTAFGGSAMGGVVRTVPVAPELDALKVKLGAGYSATSRTGGDNYNFQAVGNLPLIQDKLAIRAAAYQYQDGGFYRNRAGSDAAFRSALVIPLGAQAFAVDEEEVGDYSATGGRIAALLQASDDLKFTLSYLSQKTETDGFPLASIGPYDQTLLGVAPEHVRRGQHGGLADTDIEIGNAVMEYDFGWASLLATYSYIRGGGANAVPFTVINLPWAASFDALENHRENVGEIRLATQLDGAWNFLAGLYVEEQEDEDDRTYWWYGDPATNFFAPGERFLGVYLDQRDQTQNAAFGEVSWEFLPGLTLTGGLRAYDYERTVRTHQGGALLGPPTGTRDDTEASGTTFRANLSYQPDDNTLLYAGFSQGFRLGKPQLTAPAAICDRDGDGFFDGTNVTIESSGAVDSDAMDSFELGGKFALLDRRLTIDAALFRMEWSDIPVLLNHPTACAWAYTSNAGAALSEGMEFQANFLVTDAFRVDLGGSWIRAQLIEDVAAAGLSSGDRLPGSPEVNANLGMQYAFNVGGREVFVRADAIYIGSFYGDVQQSANLKGGGYTKLDATARIAIQNLDVDLYVRNLTNEDAFTFRGVFAFVGDHYGYRLRPRTIGVQLSYDF